MEVHHPHSHTEKRKWATYVWEFLMLFLAVFFGFFAENRREHISEANRARQYAKSLLNDMREDSFELRSAIHETAFLASAWDSVVAIMSKNKSYTDVPGSFYYYSRFASNAFSIDWSRSTINQLILSGNLRYFEDKELVEKINNYYAQQELIASKNKTDWDHRSKVTETRNRIIESKYYQVFVSLDMSDAANGEGPAAQIDSLINKRLPLQKDADKSMGSFLNDLIDRSWRNRTYINDYKSALQMVEEIIAGLKKEYHLQ